MRYIALFDTTVPAGSPPRQLDWKVHQKRVKPTEDFTPADVIDANLKLTPTSPAADVQRQAAARTKVLAAAQAWVTRLKTQENAGWRAWIAAALPAATPG